MRRFVTKNIEGLLPGKITIKEIVIVTDIKVDIISLQQTIDNQQNGKYTEVIVNDKKVSGILDEFEEGLEKKYQKEFVKLYRHFEKAINLEKLPKEKFHPLEPETHKHIKEFEYKTDNFRFYGISVPNGQIIILCGGKNKQDKDLRKFRALKMAYVEQNKL